MALLPKMKWLMTLCRGWLLVPFGSPACAPLGIMKSPYHVIQLIAHIILLLFTFIMRILPDTIFPFVHLLLMLIPCLYEPGSITTMQMELSTLHSISMNRRSFGRGFFVIFSKLVLWIYLTLNTSTTYHIETRKPLWSPAIFVTGIQADLLYTMI